MKMYILTFQQKSQNFECFMNLKRSNVFNIQVQVIMND